MASSKPLRVGFVPEHFSTPLHFAQKHFGLTAELIAFPSGTGHMITSLRSGEIDVGIGLTEGWVAGLGKEDVEGDGGYRIVGTYVETPLCIPPSFFHCSLLLEYVVRRYHLRFAEWLLIKSANRLGNFHRFQTSYKLHRGPQERQNRRLENRFRFIRNVFRVSR